MGDPIDCSTCRATLTISARAFGKREKRRPPRGAKAEGWAGIAAQLTAAVSVGVVGAAAHSAASAEAGAWGHRGQSGHRAALGSAPRAR